MEAAAAALSLGRRGAQAPRCPPAPWGWCQGGGASVSPVTLLAPECQGLKLSGVLLPGSVGWSPVTGRLEGKRGKIQVEPSS